MNQMVQQLIGEHGSELVQNLVSKLGFSAEEAQGFLPVAVEKLMAALQGGGVDIGQLVGGGGVDAVLSMLNAGEIAASSGIDEAKAAAGLGELVPNFLSVLKAQSGGAEGLLSALGGGKSDELLGAAGGLAGKLFG
jgi:hypothetical protein